jgi:hypothetical protein
LQSWATSATTRIVLAILDARTDRQREAIDATWPIAMMSAPERHAASTDHRESEDVT